MKGAVFLAEPEKALIVAEEANGPFKPRATCFIYFYRRRPFGGRLC